VNVDRPVKDASRSEWDEYGKYLGLNPDEYANKDALIDAADAAEEELDALAGPDPDAGGPVDELGEAPPPEVTPGKEGKYPEGYEDASDSWKAAYDHAVSHGNPSKTAVVFADINHDSEEFGG
jgi:hypothetical protein